ncbi:MAG: hypothetical protein HXX20_21580, partial [Chloroflexi bacterium]|nr:hypothetical protein [Chloroflexota bacterium]
MPPAYESRRLQLEQLLKEATTLKAQIERRMAAAYPTEWARLKLDWEDCLQNIANFRAELGLPKLPQEAPPLPKENQAGNTYSLSGDASKSNININSKLENVTQNTYNQAPTRQRTCPAPPPPPDHFGGRDLPLAELKRRLKLANFIAITALHGLGGIGKTTLALKLANDLFYSDKFFRAVLWADITRSPNPLSLLTSWAKHADPAFDPGNQSLNQVALQVKALLEGVIGEQCQTCASNRVLVVLDDVWENGKDAVRLLKMACPNGSTLLLTSRSENVAIDLGANRFSLDRVYGEDALQLLQTYLPEADPAALSQLATLLGGHALALTLAAKRVLRKANPARALLAQIAEYQRGLPVGTARLELGREETREDNLTLAFSYSYDDLTPDYQQRFRALGAMAQDQAFDLPMLAALWQATATETEEYCDWLRLLSLLELDKSGAEEGWYRMHPLLQAYARVLLSQDVAEYSAVLVRYQEQVIEIANQFQKLPPQEWGQLNPYLPHIHAVGDDLVEQTAALETLEDEALIRRAQSFALNTYGYLYRRMDVQMGVRRDKWLEMGLATSRKLQDQKRESLFLTTMGLVYSDLGEKGKALEYYEQA